MILGYSLWGDQDGKDKFERNLGFDRGFWSNLTDDAINGDDFASNLIPAKDVSVDTVVTSIYLNAICFLVLMATYEALRRLLPAVYSSRSKRQYKEGAFDPNEESTELSLEESPRAAYKRGSSRGSSEKSLPDIISINWVSSVFSVSWSTVRKSSGLDGYFFLRFIRMNLRICAVTSFWAFLVLVPVYATGLNQNGEEGWYHMSVANVSKGSWRMWVPSVFAYLFSGFVGVRSKFQSPAHSSDFAVANSPSLCFRRH